MNRLVIWSRGALNDLKEQADFISAENPEAARRTVVRIREAAAALGKVPIGRPGRVHGTYEKSVRGLPYVLSYNLRENPDRVAIVRLVHTSRDWPKGQWPE